MKDFTKHFLDQHDINLHSECVFCLTQRIDRLERIVKAGFDPKQPVILKELENLRGGKL